MHVRMVKPFFFSKFSYEWEWYLILDFFPIRTSIFKEKKHASLKALYNYFCFFGEKRLRKTELLFSQEVIPEWRIWKAQVWHNVKNWTWHQVLSSWQHYRIFFIASHYFCWHYGLVKFLWRYKLSVIKYFVHKGSDK